MTRLSQDISIRLSVTRWTRLESSGTWGYFIISQTVMMTMMMLMTLWMDYLEGEEARFYRQKLCKTADSYLYISSSSDIILSIIYLSIYTLSTDPKTSIRTPS
ncbi:hypothetical protein BO70DRAFT_201383 [Aspergillus heteromorphus CBS 117.55]|uniref:Uncharacterized protein n=1 Tax=Aspergillus heteromorphus CBS 117.55 TaxID=1448321 RepID=A0A317WP09_9EURO|nr:uncharacterized protein BO70DRAFT_201383 [Aspergillus heteromorphus CBS 117.55]PWY87725.1 hypothetical protein BO70DRAFT_201383 [Aspergillus heteromorphus CBS 117.55]